MDTDAELEDVLRSLRRLLKLQQVRRTASATRPSRRRRLTTDAPHALRMPRQPFSNVQPEEAPVHPDVEAFRISAQDGREALRGQARACAHERGFSSFFEFSSRIAL
jgi:hypothetical protein